MYINKYKNILGIGIVFGAMIGAFCLSSCSIGSSKENGEDMLSLPVSVIDTGTAITVKDYLGTVEGKVNVEIRPQVEGILEKIYVDEGAYVEKGQTLFKINELPYREALNNAVANANVERSKLKNARLEVERLKPLVENDVISNVRLRTAQSDYEVAQSSLDQAQAAVASARINLEFTLIKAPVSGYIGRIPKRIGNLVSKGDDQPLTSLSDTEEVYAYFAMSESDYIYFTKEAAKKDTSNDTAKKDTSKFAKSGKIIPYVSLVLADGSLYEGKGTVDAIDGQVNSGTGAVSLRATFANPDGILRSGSTGTIKMQERHPGSILVPQIATSELQNKTIVYVVGEDELVHMQAIEVGGASGDNYIVKKGLQPGDRVILAGLDKVSEGIAIRPVIQK